MLSHSSNFALSLSTHVSTKGVKTYGVFHLTGWTLGVVAVVMFVFIVLGALAPIKYELATRGYRQGPSALAVGTVSVAALAVIGCLGTLLVSWWTANPWGVDDDVDFGVVVASLAALVVYGFCAGLAYASLYDN